MFHTLCLRPIRRSWGLETQSRGLWSARASTPAPPPRWCMDRASGVVMIAFSDDGIWLLEATDPSSSSLALILYDPLARVMASQQPIANREVFFAIECRATCTAFAVAYKFFLVCMCSRLLLRLPHRNRSRFCSPEFGVPVVSRCPGGVPGGVPVVSR